MGNRVSSVQPAGPPPLLSAAVVGDATRFRELWIGEDSIHVKDAQDNNALHALFSCRIRNGKCSEILKCIHESLPVSRLREVYRARNKIGCTPLWILIAYGNVALLKEVRQKFDDADMLKGFLDIIHQSNNQGDSPFLATCSQGNVDMVHFLKEEILTTTEFHEYLAKANKKGTTPLQIIVGNNHNSLLELVLQEGEIVVQNQLLKSNTMGLSLFHICSERNAHEILQSILAFIISKESSEGRIGILDQVLSLKDKNGANAIHVAAFCGNADAIQVWIDTIKNVFSDQEDKSTKFSKSWMLDKVDGQDRTAYWLAMVQGCDEVGTLLANEGVGTDNPKMISEIEEAQEKRQNAATARQQEHRTIDGSALLNR
mmetsp:Transcript_5707/g.16332  ORF Transcript_5707/g.16332 Transcript_5707/m.16332 type:complete len:372 (-) Transcript_5707:1902-3017(-)